MSTSAIYRGIVMHRRSGHVQHRFKHRLPWFLFDLQTLTHLQRGWLFAVNAPGLLSFHDKDHGARDGTPFRDWLVVLLASRGLHNMHFKVLCLPRFFGYVFNPISVVYCFNSDRELVATVFEVHNTFGESCSYMQLSDSDEPTPKLLHVSPFFSMQGHYEFTVTAPDDTLGVAIRYFDDSGSTLFAGFQGERMTFSSRKLIRTLLTAPLATIGVTLDIHWQALMLWMKGLRIHHKPTREIQHG